MKKYSKPITESYLLKTATCIAGSTPPLTQAQFNELESCLQYPDNQIWPSSTYNIICFPMNNKDQNQITTEDKDGNRITTCTALFEYYGLNYKNSPGQGTKNYVQVTRTLKNGVYYYTFSNNTDKCQMKYQ